MNKIDTGMKNKFFMIVVYVVLWCVAILAAYTIICNSLAVSPSEVSLRSQHYFRLLVREAIELPFYCAVMFFLYKLAGGYKRYGGFAGLLRLRGGSQVANLKTMLVTLWSCGLVSLLLDGKTMPWTHLLAIMEWQLSWRVSRNWTVFLRVAYRFSLLCRCIGERRWSCWCCCSPFPSCPGDMVCYAMPF